MSVPPVPSAGSSPPDPWSGRRRVGDRRAETSQASAPEPAAPPPWRRPVWLRWLLPSLALASLVWTAIPERASHPPPGILAPAAPVQAAMGEQILAVRGYRLKLQASFTMTARVLAHARYRFADAADLVPFDVAFGWGPMSDSAVLDQFEIAQNRRWYFVKWDTPPSISERDIFLHSANMHLIPATGAVFDQLAALRRGDVVKLEGFLVHAERDEGWSWLSSLTRSDRDAGSCELVLVREVRHQQAPPPS